jgi:TonB family protein
MKKDLIISLLGHVGLLALVVLVNPATGVLRATPEIMTVDLSGLGESGPAPMPEEVAPVPHEDEPETEIEEIQPPDVPESAPDEVTEEAFAVNSPDTLETIVEEKPEPEPEPETQREPPQVEDKPIDEPESRPAEPVVAAAETETEQPQEITSEAGRGLDISTAVGGQGTGGSGEGGGAGGFGLPYNIALLERKIERVWRNPVTSSSTVKCTVYFQVGRDGQLIGQPVIEESSGIPTFDNEAVYAIMRVNQFPAFPSGFEYDYIGVHMDFAYVP